MVRLTQNQTTHDEWVAQNGNQSVSEVDSSFEQEQTRAQDESAYFSCDNDASAVIEEASTVEEEEEEEEVSVSQVIPISEELSIIEEAPTPTEQSIIVDITEDQDVLDSIATSNESTQNESVDLNSTQTTISTVDSDDSDDDDFIVGCRRQKLTVPEAKRSVSTPLPKFLIATNDDSEADYSIFTPKKTSPQKAFNIASAARLNRQSEGILEPVLNSDFDFAQRWETPKKHTSLKPRASLLSITTTKKATKTDTLFDEIDALSRGMGDLAVDEDHHISYTPNKLKRPPKIFKRTSSSIFDLSDSESDKEVFQSSRLVPKTPVTMPRAKPRVSKSLAPKTVERQQRKDFEETKDTFAKEYLAQLDEKVNGGAVGRLTSRTGGVQLVWTNSKQTTAGTCQVRRFTAMGDNPEYFSCTITLEVKVCDDFDRVKNTLAHEYTHACVDILEIDRRQLKNEGPHGALFKTWAKKVGKAMGIPIPTTCHDMVINFKFEYQCPNCTHIYRAHSRKKEWTTTKGCEKCRVPLVQIKPVPRTAKKEGGPGSGLTAYQIFQKETFARLKAELPPGTPFQLGAMQKEVTKLWKEEKAKLEAGQGASGKSSFREKLEAARRESTSTQIFGVDDSISEDLKAFEKLVITID
ncbi:hypothetical protein H072_3608 [Dactylellina haptotyla CBS 200.50]|uniref:SprT-like domain-containing protein n=1 Tax=Dactylellina haptotyla (strain CBS 200.50) TaxID=1284197 RepID=S8C405_DACHA|nr:hypothetical protein H072_3608 [Dactylellina haptotyla CBS 200.50]